MRMLRPRARHGLALAAAVAGITGAVTGCYEGMPPTFVIPPSGEPPVFLPRDFQLGTLPSLGLLYFYDQSRFTEYKNEGGRNQIPPETEPRFIKRGSVLGIIGASTAQVAQPDTTDPELARVYNDPRLFGFEPATDRAPGFYEGTTVIDAATFMPPCMAAGNCGPTWWSYNHVQFQWSRKDSLAGTTMSATSGGATTWVMRSQNEVSQSLRETHLPSRYAADWWWSVVPGRGIFQHGMTLTAERDEVKEVGTGAPKRQRNPTFFWLSQRSLGATDQNQIEYTTLDQCVDAMWGDLLLYPLQLSGADFQVGDRYVTWTYVGADSAEIRRRVTQGDEREQLRCSGSGVTPAEVPLDSSAFPIFYFTLLVRYDVVVERVYDVLEWRSGNNVVGEYGARDGIADAVKLVIQVFLAAPREKLVQRVDLYLMRGIGVVVQQNGLDVLDVSRLREAQIDGQIFPPEYFKYVD